MNAKKIMGAVLVALLAAALFVGAASATDYGTVFTYQDTDVATPQGGVLPEGVWTNGAATVTVGADKVVYPGANFVAGTYKLGDHKVYVTYPTATYPVNAVIGSTINYLVANGGNVYKDSVLTINVNPSAKNIDATNVLVTYPNGTVLNISKTLIQGTALTAEKGTYKIQAIFDKGTDFVAGVPANLLLDTVSALTFTVVGTEDATLSASVDTLYAGETLTATVKGTPGTIYAFGFENFETPETDQFVTLTPYTGKAGYYNFTMPNNGEASFQFTVAAGADDDATIKLFEAADLADEIGTIEITVSAAVVTATLGADSYYVGDVIKISGTSTAGITEAYKFNITGTNFKETTLPVVSGSLKTGKTWEVELETDGVTSEGKGLDVGTYTISIEKDGVAVKTLAVALKQPFISILEAPEVVVQGTDAEFIVNAEATKAQVKAYVFGTNYFLEVDHIKKTEKDVDNKFTLTINKTQTSAKNMSAGQYFMVIQHPMYDGAYNIQVDGSTFYLNTSGNAVAGNAGTTELFNVNDRQTANAAQALCDALDTQNIDDMYVKYSFFVVGEDESFTISEIPSQVVKGDKIVISGVDTANAEEAVVVEMISTAFAAVPKETVGSAAFIVATAKIADDGTWEVTLDTSDLNVDEYSLSVAVSNSDKPWKNTKINVVEGADEPDTPDTPDVPDTPDTPDTPTEPETPGFGALAALAGLGAVAVLLLRRE